MAEYESRDSDNVRLDWWTPLDVTSGKMNFFSQKRLYTTYFSLCTDDIKDTLPHVSLMYPHVSQCIPMSLFAETVKRVKSCQKTVRVKS